MRQTTPVVVTGVTLIDGTGAPAQADRAILIESGRIKTIGATGEVPVPTGATVIEGRGKFAIPGLMNANVHLLCDVRLENLTRYWGRYEDLIAEAAQVALKSGLTTVFDTWGPRRHLMAVRDRIAAGEAPGSRIFCAGNIIGIDGPLSADFFPKAAELASPTWVERINALWVENVGRHLGWLAPEQVADEIRTYLGTGIDFVKYASNDHNPGAFLTFSAETQAAIVATAHAAGVSAQAHTMSVEGLRIAVTAGCDLIQHANLTGPTPIPATTLEAMAQRRMGAVVFPWTQRGLDWIAHHVSASQRPMWQVSDRNARELIQCGVPLLLANDGALFSRETTTDPRWRTSWASAPAEESLIDLATGHFNWFAAMEEKGCEPLRMLQAATRNIAVAYGKDRDLGTLEPGKIADLLLLDKNPLLAAANYRSIHLILKEGVSVDREALPLTPMLTAPADSPVAEQARYVPFLPGGGFPPCILAHLCH